MPRKKKKAEPVAVADTLEELKESIPGLKAATELPRQLAPAEPELLPLPKAGRTPDESGIDHKLAAEFLEDIKQGPGYANLASTPREPTTEPAAAPMQPEPAESEQTGLHAAAVLGSRPRMQPTPPGFMGVASFPPTGVRVNKSLDYKTVSLQFSEEKPLSRAIEYDLMERVQDSGFSYKPVTRQWERQVPEGMTLGDNTMDAVKIAREINDARSVGRGR